MVIAAHFTIAKYWKQPKCPSVNEWIKNLWYIYMVEYYATERKKELLPFKTAWMELESIYVKWNKPDGEVKIPYDLTFNWNIIKKKKKGSEI